MYCKDKIFFNSCYNYSNCQPGHTGSTGNTGPDGFDGFTGSTGETGNTGFAGMSGINGSIGSTGNTGLIGDMGPTGLTGSTGTIGLSGSIGENGLAGPDGRTGPTGFIGFDGPNGINGDLGPFGVTGSTGPNGEITPPILQNNSVTFWSQTIQPINLDNTYIALQMEFIFGSMTNSWSSLPGNTTFISTISGWYEISYKIDYNLGIAPAPSETFGSGLYLNGTIIPGSGVLSEGVPDDRHMYCVFNTIQFNYTAGDVLSLLVLEDPGTNGSTIGSVLPILGDWNLFTEAVVTMHISQIF